MIKLSKTDHAMLLKVYGFFDGVWYANTHSIATRQQTINFLKWEYVAEKKGLSISAGRADAEALRRLTAAGYLLGTGDTKSKAYKLTPSGLAYAISFFGWTFADLDGVLTAIKQDVKNSKVFLPGTQMKISIVNFETLKDQHHIETAISALLILGLVTRYSDSIGHIVAYAVNPDAALPQAEVFETRNTCGNFEAYEPGFEAGLKLAFTKPPHETDNIVPRLLPCSKWW